MKAELIHQEEAIGHVCTCGEKVLWPSYVFAHMNDNIVFVCDKCGQTTCLNKGTATHQGVVVKPKTKKK